VSANYPRIVSTPDTCWGEPRLNGSRLTVIAVVGRFVAGESMDGICADYDISEAQFLACVRAVCQAAWTPQGLRAPVHAAMEKAAIAATEKP